MERSFREHQPNNLKKDQCREDHIDYRSAILKYNGDIRGVDGSDAGLRQHKFWQTTANFQIVFHKVTSHPGS